MSYNSYPKVDWKNSTTPSYTDEVQTSGTSSECPTRDNFKANFINEISVSYPLYEEDEWYKFGDTHLGNVKVDLSILSNTKEACMYKEDIIYSGSIKYFEEEGAILKFDRLKNSRTYALTIYLWAGINIEHKNSVVVKTKQDFNSEFGANLENKAFFLIGKSKLAYDAKARMNINSSASFDSIHKLSSGYVKYEKVGMIIKTYFFLDPKSGKLVERFNKRLFSGNISDETKDVAVISDTPNLDYDEDIEVFFDLSGGILKVSPIKVL